MNSYKSCFAKSVNRFLFSFLASATLLTCTGTAGISAEEQSVPDNTSIDCSLAPSSISHSISATIPTETRSQSDTIDAAKAAAKSKSALTAESPLLETKGTTGTSVNGTAQDGTDTATFDSSSGKTYKAEIKIDTVATVISPRNPAQQIDDITNEMVNTDDKRTVSTSRKIFRKLGDMAQYATTCKGFHSSSEGADLILSEKEKELSKNTTASDYLKQRRYDGLHAQVAGCVFQIAMGLGTNEANHKDQFVNTGYLKLKDLIGEEKAQAWLNSLTSWSEQIKSENRKMDLDTLDVLTIQNKSAQVVNTALQNDDVVKTIRAKLHKYNGHSKFSQISNKVINTSLSLAALTPTFVSPAAQFTQFCYIAATGGPEESKLLKELYFDRRLEARLHRLDQETTMALTNYNIAVLTKNAALLGCCESVIKNMVGDEGSAAILPSSTNELAVAN